MQAHILSETYHLLFEVFLLTLLYQCLWQLGSKFRYPVIEGWDDIWLQDYGPNSPGLLLSELLLCSLWFPSLADLLGMYLSRSHSTDSALVLGLQRLSQYNVSAPVLTEMFLSFPFPASVECLGQHMSHPGREAEKELVFHCSVYWFKRLFLLFLQNRWAQ